MDDQTLLAPKRWLKNRRSKRIEMSLPVVVYREAAEGPQFYERTKTLVVSAHGALVSLTDLVTPRQRLHMQNPNTGENLECKVISVVRSSMGPPRVAVEFTRATPGFWRIAFPPADWSGGN